MVGKKSPCGSALGRTELGKYIFYSYKTQKQRFSIYKNIEGVFLVGKNPAGAHLDTPSSESTCFMYLRYKKQRFSIYKI